MLQSRSRRPLSCALAAALAVLVSIAALGCTRDKGELEKHIDGLQAAGVPINGGIARAMAKACEDSDARACADLGAAIETAMRQAPEARVENPCIVHALFTTACDDDDAKGCYALGRHFIAGTCTDRDAARGLGLIDKSCKAGYLPACSYLEADAKGHRPASP